MNVLRLSYITTAFVAFMAIAGCSGGGGGESATPPPPDERLKADAGPDQSKFVGTFVTLDGSKSTNSNQTGLIYAWTLAKPAGSNATLSNPTSVNPTLTVDTEGTYEATLIVSDARQTSLHSAPDTVVVTADKTDLRPTAHAGDDRNVFVNQPFTLDGSGSRASGNKSLTFNWSFKERPTGSNATLSDATAKRPSFTPDISGSYKLGLVVNDGTKDSTEDDVTITASVKPPPTADAGPPQSAKPGTVITLDGSKSSAVPGFTLRFSWSLTRPDGNPGNLDNATTPSPTFIAQDTDDQLGDWVAQLIVNDSTDNSTPKTVVITIRRDAPVAKAGDDQPDVRVCRMVTLNGNASRNKTGGTSSLSYFWELISLPANSNSIYQDAVLVSPNSVSSTFTADMAGDYEAKLTVTENGVSSSDSVKVTAVSFYNAGKEPNPSGCNGASCHTGVGPNLSKRGIRVLTVLQDKPSQHNGNALLSDNNNREDFCTYFQAH